MGVCSTIFLVWSALNPVVSTGLVPCQFDLFLFVMAHGISADLIWIVPALRCVQGAHGLSVSGALILCF